MRGRAYRLEKNKINFTALNRSNNLIRNSGFELWTSNAETLELEAPLLWTPEFLAETPEVKAIKNTSFGLLAPQVSDTAISSNWLAYSQQVQNAGGDTLTLNGTYNLKARIKGDNGTANSGTLRLRAVATSGSFTVGSSVSTVL